MKRKQTENSEQSKERWEFIEKASKEVDSWSDSKKAEVYPSKFRREEEKIDVSSLNSTHKLNFK
ncbi:MAG TPA: hypothetical protein VGC76_14675 [Pyrinomonadaceae bacterium]|jgi:hypothetical protein